jgi:N-methylhydantoinase A/oxoprolinase/acetone carboxylase beta subunit
LLADYEDDVDAALAFLDSIAKKVNRASPGSAASSPTGSSLGGGGTKPQINREAYMLARILQGKLQLNRKQDIATTKVRGKRTPGMLGK